MATTTKSSSTRNMPTYEHQLHPSVVKSNANRPVGIRAAEKEFTCHECEVVEGKIPTWLAEAGGAIYKQSGGDYEVDENKPLKSVFEDTSGLFLNGLAHIVAFKFSSGCNTSDRNPNRNTNGGHKDQGGAKVVFSNKYMRTGDYAEFVSTGRKTFIGASNSLDFNEVTKIKKKGRKTWVVPDAEIKYGKDPEIGREVNPNVNCWLLDAPSSEKIGRKSSRGSRLTDVNSKHSRKRFVIGAATEADGSICAFDFDTLDTTQVVRCMPTQYHDVDRNLPKPERNWLFKLIDGFKSNSRIFTTAAHYFYEPVGSVSETSTAGSNPDATSSTSQQFHIGLEMYQAGGYLPPTFEFGYTVFAGHCAPLTPIYYQKLATLKYLDNPEALDKKYKLSERPSYMHTVARTKNYLICFLGQRKLSYGKLLQLIKGKSIPFFDLFDKEPDQKLEFLILKVENNQGKTTKDDRTQSRHSVDSVSKVQHVATVPCQEISCHVWHVDNAFEDEATGLLTIRCSVESGAPGIGEFVIDVGKKQMVSENIISGAKSPDYDEAASNQLTPETHKSNKLSNPGKILAPHYEFPGANPNFHGKKYRFGYWLANPFQQNSFLSKIDYETRQEKRFCFEEDLVPSEPVFVPRPNSTEEDDGVVLNIALDLKEEASFLFVYDGKTCDLLAKVKAPMVCNLGLHTNWIPNLKELGDSQFSTWLKF